MNIPKIFLVPDPFRLTKKDNQVSVTSILTALVLLLTGPFALAQTTYTWTEYTNATPQAAIARSWGDNPNWDGNGVFVSGASNDLVFFDNTSTRLEQEGSLNITGIPAALSMNAVTFNGRGPNNPFGTAILIGDNTSTWTIGDGTTSTITQNAAAGGGGDRYVNYTVGANIILNQAITTFTGNGGGPQGLVFSGDISEAAAGYGITKTGNHLLVLEGTNSYTGATTVSAGTLRIGNANALPGGLGSSGGLSNLTLSGGTLELSGNFLRDLGTGSGQFRITGGNSGFSARGGPLNITVNNDPNQELVWGSANFNPGRLILNQSTADGTLTLNNGLDLGSSNRNIDVNGATAIINGVIRSSGGSPDLNKNGGGTLILNGSNTYTGDTRLNAGTLSIETADNAGIGGNIVFNGGTLQVRGTTLTQLTGLGHTVTLVNNRTVGFDIADANNIFTADLAFSGTGGLNKAGKGTLILNQANSYTGRTSISGGGTVVLDNTIHDNAKLPTDDLNSSGGAIILRGGTHAHEVDRLTLVNGGGTFAISRDGGTATINLNTINRSSRQGASLAIAEDNIATTDRANTTSGILGGWATVGSNWAKNDTNGANGAIVGLSSGDYTVVTTSGGSGTDNLQLTGSQTLTGNITGNTLRISNAGNDDVLDINTRSLRISRPNGEGGLLYAGGFNDRYTITGTTGTLNPQNGNQELIINVYQGTLDIGVRVLPNGSSQAPLSKNGNGTLVLSAGNNYTATTFLNQGVLRLANDTAAGNTNNGIIGQNGTAVELSNNITVGSEALSISGTGIANGGALRNVSGNNTYGGPITIGASGARINSDSTTMLTLTGGIRTSGGQNVIFGGDGDTTVSTEAISGGGGLSKDGAGTLTLTGNNTYTGETLVRDGTLIVDGDISSSSRTTVLSGATIGGSGTLGSLTIDAGGTFSPGNSPEITTVAGDYIQNGTLIAEISGLTAGPGGHDRVDVTGEVTLNGDLNLIFDTFTPVQDDLVFLLLNDGSDAVSGTFTGLAQGDVAASYGGFDWEISYNGDFDTLDFSGVGNDIVLRANAPVAIPEPHTALLACMGAMLGLLRRKRKN